MICFVSKDDDVIIRCTNTKAKKSKKQKPKLSEHGWGAPREQTNGSLSPVRHLAYRTMARRLFTAQQWTLIGSIPTVSHEFLLKQQQQKEARPHQHWLLFAIRPEFSVSRRGKINRITRFTLRWFIFLFSLQIQLVGFAPIQNQRQCGFNLFENLDIWCVLIN